MSRQICFIAVLALLSSAGPSWGKKATPAPGKSASARTPPVSAAAPASKRAAVTTAGAETDEPPAPTGAAIASVVRKRQAELFAGFDVGFGARFDSLDLGMPRLAPKRDGTPRYWFPVHAVLSSTRQDKGRSFVERYECVVFASVIEAEEGRWHVEGVAASTQEHADFVKPTNCKSLGRKGR